MEEGYMGTTDINTKVTSNCCSYCYISGIHNDWGGVGNHRWEYNTFMDSLYIPLINPIITHLFVKLNFSLLHISLLYWLGCFHVFNFYWQKKFNLYLFKKKFLLGKGKPQNPPWFRKYIAWIFDAWNISETDEYSWWQSSVLREQQASQDKKCPWKEYVNITSL